VRGGLHHLISRQGTDVGTGQMPLVYVTLPDSQRQAVREEVRMKLLSYISNGRLEMSVEMLIGSGRA